MRIRKSKKNKQHNGQWKKDKMLFFFLIVKEIFLLSEEEYLVFSDDI
jgi:hypothetical protein